MLLKTKLGKELLWNGILLGIDTSIVFASFDVRFSLDEGNVIDIQLHDTYFVIGYFHFIVLLWIVFALCRYSLLSLAYLSTHYKIVAILLLIVTITLIIQSFFVFIDVFTAGQHYEEMLLHDLSRNMKVYQLTTIVICAVLVYCSIWLGRQLFSTSKPNR
ncbi:hypothetical protein QNI19_36740 [Cytophagaceae bacterium DM2B3-1]|uniref:Uncharacterized protein n=1 Tax=Xanthocytophaga flava TaxID=3048013 RepID=A0ABT7CXR8_9BACT|nr:hypothetical protein [Xanthocytophaga flavus]MDJ1498542.1 hypothetical protein [Xanthocytophaga flavus]